jgi:hypothetical protein
MSSVGNTIPSFEVSQLNKYIKYINFVIIYIVTFSLVCIREYEIVGMGLLLSFNFIIQPLLLYDIFSLNDRNNSVFLGVIGFGILLSLLSSVYVLKMLVQVQTKNHEVGNVTQYVDKNTNTKYHDFSNSFMVNVGLIIINAILYFIHRFSNNINYSNNYLYNTLEYINIDYSFFENIYNRTNEFTKDNIFLLLGYIFIYLGILFWNLLIAIFVNLIKTLHGLYNKFFHTLLFLFKSVSLITIVVLSCKILYLSTTIARIRFKKTQSKSSSGSNADSSKNASVFTQMSTMFNNLNMNYLMNYKIVT